MGITDKQLVARRFRAARPTYDAEATIQQRIVEHLTGMLKDFDERKHFDKVWEFGCGTGILTAHIDSEWDIARWVLNDLDETNPLSPSICLRHPQSVEYLCGDVESIDAGRGFDLIASSSTLQWLHYPLQFLSKLHHHLQPSGVICISTFGPDNLHEVRSLTGHGLAYCTADEWHRVLSPIFQNVCVTEEKIGLYFDDGREVLRHLKRTGVGAAPGPEERWTPERMRRFCREYARRFGTPAGRLSLTYHPIYLLARL